jgi:hypothetical protein
LSSPGFVVVDESALQAAIDTRCRVKFPSAENMSTDGCSNALFDWPTLSTTPGNVQVVRAGGGNG